MAAVRAEPGGCGSCLDRDDEQTNKFCKLAGRLALERVGGVK